MTIPDQGVAAFQRYVSDDGGNYATTVWTNFIYQEPTPGYDPADAPLPHAMSVRGWIVRSPDTEPYYAFVMCPHPFSLLANPNMRSLTAVGGQVWEVISRVGEKFAQFRE